MWQMKEQLGIRVFLGYSEPEGICRPFVVCALLSSLMRSEEPFPTVGFNTKPQRGGLGFPESG